MSLKKQIESAMKKQTCKLLFVCYQMHNHYIGQSNYSDFSLYLQDINQYLKYDSIDITFISEWERINTK